MLETENRVCYNTKSGLICHLTERGINMQQAPTALRIREQLLELMKLKDIGQIKVPEIVTALSISRNTFYSYYESTYDVLQEIEDEHVAELRRINTRYKDLPLDNRYFHEPYPAMVEILHFMNSKRHISRILWGPHGDPVFQSRTCGLIRENFLYKALRERYILKPNDLVAAFLVGGHQSMVTYWLLNDTNASEEDMAVLLYRMMFGFYHN